MTFLNRTDELAALQDNWTAPNARFFVLWGRRRVGKTELISRFVEGKRGFYFEATDTVEVDQLRDLSLELARATNNSILAQQPITSWPVALDAISDFAAKERTVVVFDEFQYLAIRNPGLATLLNRWWRESGRHLPLVLIIAGSELSFFEREVLGGQMYGRRTGQLKLTPFDFRSAALFTPNYTAQDKVRTHAICGGMPYYLEQFDDKLPLGENILNQVLFRHGLLHEEADLMLRQELPHPHNYVSTLRAIAHGNTRSSQIINWTQLDSSQVSQTLRVLERLELVEQHRPVTVSARSKKTNYAIADGFLNFHFRFVDPHRSRMRTREDAERHLRQTVLPELDHFVSKPAWERMCQEYVQAEEDAKVVGSWWGKVPVVGGGRRNEDAEIDIVAVGQTGEIVACGSCKWTNSQLTIAQEAQLSRVEAHLPKSGNVRRHYFFSRSGFDRKLKVLAEKDPERYRLVSPENLYK